MRRSQLRLFALAVVAACGQDTVSPHTSVATPSAIVVSNATTNVPALATTRAAASKNAVSYSVSTGAPADEVTYVSLLPNSAPGGTTALVSNPRKNVVVTAEMVDGGLDPVPIRADVGDTIRVDIFVGGVSGPHFDRVVPKKAPPTIVRSIPARGKTGVPLNKSIVVVFSEPVSPASISSNTISLFRGSSQVSGTAQILAGVTAAVVFQPDAPLAANTEYQLVVTNSVRDIDGDAPDSSVTIPFTTGTTTEGPVADLNLVPSRVRVHVGDQFQAQLTITDAQGNVLTGKPITWFVDVVVVGDEGIVSVTNTGLVTANREGTGFILAQVGDFLTGMAVLVSSTQSDVRSVTLSADTLTLPVNDTADLSVSTKDIDGNLVEFRLVQWATSNPSVATATPVRNNRARVEGIAAGTAKIIATVEGVSDTTVVSVGPLPPATGVVVVPDADTLLLRQTEQLSAMSRNAAGGRAPLKGTDVQWESSNPDVMTVDASGVVTGAGAGSATITAHWSGFSSNAKFIVNQIALQSVSAGKQNTCGVTTAGVSYCWGAAAFGQTGRPGISDVALGGAGVVYYPWPIPGDNPITFSEVVTGGYHACGITTTSAAYCWGLNDNGELGNGTLAGGWRATLVFGGRTFSEVRAGASHSCAVTLAHVAYCWGLNSSGQLGSDAGASSTTPLAVAGGLAFNTLSLGDSHTCGLTTAGQAYCWGLNSGGQLGVGDNVTSSSAPLAVSGGLAFTSISAGSAHTCAITSDGALYCWGWNFEGELGNGNTPIRSTIPVQVAPGHTFVAVGSGGHHTCAIDSAHQLYCWGLNSNGQLGLGAGSGDQFATPQLVAGGMTFAKLSVGITHSCAATSDGAWYCWGKNDSGQLGTGDTGDASIPLKVLGQP